MRLVLFLVLIMISYPCAAQSWIPRANMNSTSDPLEAYRERLREQRREYQEQQMLEEQQEQTRIMQEQLNEQRRLNRAAE